MKPKNFFTSIIHIPARGKTANDDEKVPIIKSGTLKPTPNIKSSKKPMSLLFNVVTILKSKTRPGDKQGDATVPLAAPNKKAERNEPLLVLVERGFKNDGTYISYQPNIAPPR